MGGQVHQQQACGRLTGRNTKVLACLRTARKLYSQISVPPKATDKRNKNVSKRLQLMLTTYWVSCHEKGLCQCFLKSQTCCCCLLIKRDRLSHTHLGKRLIHYFLLPQPAPTVAYQRRNVTSLWHSLPTPTEQILSKWPHFLSSKFPWQSTPSNGKQKHLWKYPKGKCMADEATFICMSNALCLFIIHPISKTGNETLSDGTRSGNMTEAHKISRDLLWRSEQITTVKNTASCLWMGKCVRGGDSTYHRSMPWPVRHF